MSEDFQDSLRTEVHDEANQSSIAALDAEEACLEDTIRAGIVADLRAFRDRLTEGMDEPMGPIIRDVLTRAEKIASGVTL